MGSILANCLIWRSQQHRQNLVLESGCMPHDEILLHKSWKSRSRLTKVSNPALYAVEFCTLRPLVTVYLVLKFPESDDLFGPSHRAVIDDGRLLSTATLHVTIHSIVAHVQPPSNKPDRDQHGRSTTKATTCCRLLNMLLNYIYLNKIYSITELLSLKAWWSKILTKLKF